MIGIRWFYRALRQGEGRWLFLVLLLASFSLTLVGQIKSNALSAMTYKSEQCLMGDIRIQHTRPLPQSLLDLASNNGLKVAQTRSTQTMLQLNGQFQLVQLTVVDKNFLIQPQGLWVEPNVLSDFGLQLNDRAGIGRTQLPITNTHSLACSTNIFSSFLPNAWITEADFQPLGLISAGSRLTYSVYLQGDRKQTEAFEIALKESNLDPNQLWTLTTKSTLTQDVSQTLQNTLSFLDLAVLTTLLISGLSILIAARVQLTRWFESLLLMRAMGASKRQISSVLVTQLGLLCLISSLLGVFLGMIAFGLSLDTLKGLLGPFEHEYRWDLGLQSIVLTLITLTGFASASYFQHRKAILKGHPQQKATFSNSVIMSLAMGVLSMGLVSLWLVSPKLAFPIVGALVCVLIIFATLAQLTLLALSKLKTKLTRLPKLAVAQLLNQGDLFRIQIIALGSILFLLMMLSFIKNDLVSAWQNSLPENAPNAFLINVQPFEQPEIETLLNAQVSDRISDAVVRGRLTHVNQIPLDIQSLPLGRGQRLAKREANIAMMTELPNHNPILATQKTQLEPDEIEVSVEQGIAELFGLKLGDQLTFSLNGFDVQTRITSLRAVQWQSLKLNFFFILKTPVNVDYGPTYMSNFKVDETQSRSLQKAIKSVSPGALFFDVSAQIKQVKDIMQQASDALSVMFYLALIASILVVFSAIEASSRARWQSWWLLKTLGAKIKDIRGLAHLEFIVLGLISGIVAALIALSSAWAIGHWVFDIKANLSLIPVLMHIGFATVLIWGLSAIHLESAIRLSPKELEQKIKGSR